MRRNLAGPGASGREFTPTHDPGKAAPAGTGGGYRRAGDVAGPTSSHAT